MDDIANTFNTIQPVVYGGTGSSTANAAIDALGGVGRNHDQSALSASNTVKANIVKNALQSWETVADIVLASPASTIVQLNIDQYRVIHIEGWLYPTAAANIYIRFSANNGSTFDGGNNYTNLQLLGVQSSTVSMVTGPTNYIDLFGGQVGPSLSRAIQIDTYIYQAREARVTRVTTKADGADGASVIKMGLFRGVHTVALAQNAFLIGADSTTLAGGEITIRGKR